MGRRAFVKDRILHAAFDLMAKRGYEAVSTREIAEAAEVGSASMFKHFPSKEALGRELYRVALAPLLAQFADLLSEHPNPADSIARAIGLLYAAYDGRPRALALLIFEPHDFTPWEVDRANPHSVRRVLQALIGADDDLEAIVWGAITGPLVDRYLRRRAGTMQQHAASHAALVKALLSVPPASPPPIQQTPTTVEHP